MRENYLRITALIKGSLSHGLFTAAVPTFMILSFFCSNRNQSFDSITYEFYLIHYVVLRGDFGINKFWTGSYSSADVIVVIILAFTLKIITKYFKRSVFTKISI